MEPNVMGMVWLKILRRQGSVSEILLVPLIKEKKLTRQTFKEQLKQQLCASPLQS